MSDLYVIPEEKLTGIADAIREKSSSSAALTLDEMPGMIRSIVTGESILESSEVVFHQNYPRNLATKTQLTTAGLSTTPTDIGVDNATYNLSVLEEGIDLQMYDAICVFDTRCRFKYKTNLVYPRPGYSGSLYTIYVTKFNPFVRTVSRHEMKFAYALMESSVGYEAGSAGAIAFYQNSAGILNSFPGLSFSAPDDLSFYTSPEATGEYVSNSVVNNYFRGLKWRGIHTMMMTDSRYFTSATRDDVDVDNTDIDRHVYFLKVPKAQTFQTSIAHLAIRNQPLFPNS